MTDLAEIDIARTQQTLRAGTLATIDRVLGSAAPAVPATHLNAWLVDEIDRSPLAERAQRRAERIFIFADPPDDQALWSRLARRVPARGLDQLAEAARALWTRRSEAPAPTGAGALFVPLAYMLAADVTLHHAIALRLKRAMEARVLFFPDLPPHPVIAPQTALLLLAGGDLLAKLTGPARDSLRRIAVQEAAQPGWADFWDLWILDESVRTSVVTLPEGMAPMPAWTSEVAAATPGLAKKSGNEDTRLAAGWTERRPSYCMLYRNGLP
jgi:hypothetical protein